MISILIPTHNHICIDLVQAIHLQAENSHYPFEIIVADDASTDLQAKKANRLIGEMQGCSYIELNQNIGPARIRNFLVSQAKYSYISFPLFDRLYPIRPSGQHHLWRICLRKNINTKDVPAPL